MASDRNPHPPRSSKSLSKFRWGDVPIAVPVETSKGGLEAMNAGSGPAGAGQVTYGERHKSSAMGGWDGMGG